jgi:hypothetical protein
MRSAAIGARTFGIAACRSPAGRAWHVAGSPHSGSQAKGARQLAAGGRPRWPRALRLKGGAPVGQPIPSWRSRSRIVFSRATSCDCGVARTVSNRPCCCASGDLTQTGRYLLTRMRSAMPRASFRSCCGNRLAARPPRSAHQCRSWASHTAASRQTTRLRYNPIPSRSARSQGPISAIKRAIASGLVESFVSRTILPLQSWALRPRSPF